jgi:hypothetical protein
MYPGPSSIMPMRLPSCSFRKDIDFILRCVATTLHCILRLNAREYERWYWAPWRAILENLIVAQMMIRLAAFYGTRRSITIRARYRLPYRMENCCWPSPAQSIMVLSPEGLMTIFNWSLVGILHSHLSRVRFPVDTYYLQLYM